MDITITINEIDKACEAFNYDPSKNGTQEEFMIKTLKEWILGNINGLTIKQNIALAQTTAKIEVDALDVFGDKAKGIGGIVVPPVL